MTSDHVFGGNHTEDKIRYVKAYLEAWANVLKNMNFERIYIDSFAGTGSRTIRTRAAPLLGEEEISKNVDGSARIALSVSPSFDRYIFIESDLEKIEKLEQLKIEFPQKKIQIIHGDANECLKELCQNINWKGKNSTSWGTRAVLLLDPYGMDVEWSTLEVISKTEAIDVWYLFSIVGLIRQAARRWNVVEDYKIDRINRCLGTAAWQEAFYEETTKDLFDQTEIRRTADEKVLNKFVKSRLEEIFGWVSEPIDIRRHDNNVLLFSLFFGVGNHSPKAIGAARRIVTHLQKLLN